MQRGGGGLLLGVGGRPRSRKNGGEFLLGEVGGWVGGGEGTRLERGTRGRPGRPRVGAPRAKPTESPRGVRACVRVCVCVRVYD